MIGQFELIKFISEIPPIKQATSLNAADGDQNS